jgi:hypothetical protein
MKLFSPFRKPFFSLSLKYLLRTYIIERAVESGKRGSVEPLVRVLDGGDE